MTNLTAIMDTLITNFKKYNNLPKAPYTGPKAPPREMAQWEIAFFKWNRIIGKGFLWTILVGTVLGIVVFFLLVIFDGKRPLEEQKKKEAAKKKQ